MLEVKPAQATFLMPRQFPLFVSTAGRPSTSCYNDGSFLKPTPASKAGLEPFRNYRIGGACNAAQVRGRPSLPLRKCFLIVARPNIVFVSSAMRERKAARTPTAESSRYLLDANLLPRIESFGQVRRCPCHLCLAVAAADVCSVSERDLPSKDVSGHRIGHPGLLCFELCVERVASLTVLIAEQ